MIEKSPDITAYETADSIIDEFRDAVQQAQQRAIAAGVDFVFVVNETRYTAKANGEFERLVPLDGE